MIDLTSFSILAQDVGPPVEAVGIFFLLYFVCFGVSLVASLLLMVFWIWMIIDCVNNEPSEGNDKLIWILIIVLTNWVGAAIYYFVRRPKRKATHGK